MKIPVFVDLWLAATFCWPLGFLYQAVSDSSKLVAAASIGGKACQLFELFDTLLVARKIEVIEGIDNLLFLCLT